MCPLLNKTRLNLPSCRQDSKWPPSRGDGESEWLGCRVIQSSCWGPYSSSIAKEWHPDVLNWSRLQAAVIRVPLIDKHPLSCLDCFLVHKPHECRVCGVVEANAVIKHNEVVVKRNAKMLLDVLETKVDVHSRTEARSSKPRVSITVGSTWQQRRAKVQRSSSLVPGISLDHPAVGGGWNLGWAGFIQIVCIEEADLLGSLCGDETPAGLRDRHGDPLQFLLATRGHNFVVQRLAHLGVPMEELNIPIRTGEGIGILKESHVVQINTPIDLLLRVWYARWEPVPDSEALEVDELAAGASDGVVKPFVDK
mmetsp:Transcript_1181/g.1386  ORF Transcript_1181/g.1386 Transcript_1181/m.1386 type:complete len:309 (+) Transcript_1181:108-1034(+)